jgi:hypothetical protein
MCNDLSTSVYMLKLKHMWHVNTFKNTSANGLSFTFLQSLGARDGRIGRYTRLATDPPVHCRTVTKSTQGTSRPSSTKSHFPSAALSQLEATTLALRLS